MGLTTVRVLLWLPLVAFVAVLALVAGGLIRPHDTTIASRMVGRPVPAFSLPRADSGVPFADAGLRTGQPHLVNLFASWCVPCAAEAPQLMALRGRGVPIVGIAIRDQPQDLRGFLDRNGNPYTTIALDDRAALQVALGSSGVPESFVVDGRGVIRQQIIGEIRADQLDDVAQAVEQAR